MQLLHTYRDITKWFDGRIRRHLIRVSSTFEIEMMPFWRFEGKEASLFDHNYEKNFCRRWKFLFVLKICLTGSR